MGPKGPFKVAGARKKSPRKGAVFSSSSEIFSFQAEAIWASITPMLDNLCDQGIKEFGFVSDSTVAQYRYTCVACKYKLYATQLVVMHIKVTHVQELEEYILPAAVVCGSRCGGNLDLHRDKSWQEPC